MVRGSDDFIRTRDNSGGEENTLKRLASITDWIITKGNTFWFILLFAILLRLGSLFAIIIDHDEWTYWQMASEWLSGETLYKDIVDIKPPGIFGVFAILKWISLNSIVLARFWSTVLLAIAAWCAGKVSHKLLGASTFGAALLFLLGFSYPYGRALNTELFFVSLSAIGLYLALVKKNTLPLIFGGLLLGYAFSIKYMAIAEIGFVFLFILMQNQEDVAPWKLKYVAGRLFFPG